jgi:hypothetical protein
MLNTSTNLKETKENKKNNKKSKQLKVVSIDLIEQVKENEKEIDKLEIERLEHVRLEHERLEHERLAKQKTELAINNIDLLYFANQNQNQNHALKTNKLEQLLSTNYLLKDIYNNIEENIAIYKEQIIKYNETTLEKLIENNSKTTSGEKYKLYYLLYVLNLITYLKEKKIKNSIKEELKDFNNNSNYCDDGSLNDFNLYNTTLNSMCTKKQITNLDLFVVRKTTNNKQKILPQKRS